MRRIIALAGVLSAGPLLAQPPLAPSIPGDARPIWMDGPGTRGTVVYSNITYDTGYYCDFEGYEGGDGLSMISGGELEEFTVAWHDPPDGLAATEMYIRFYEGPALVGFMGDGTDVPLATYMDDELPGEGTWMTTYTVPDPVALPAEIVVTVQWAAEGPAYGVGLRIMDPPTVGSSEDWYYIDHPLGVWRWFEGDPVANFGFEVVVSGAEQYSKADMDCSGSVDAFDIDPFVLAVTDPGGYALAYPGCDIDNGDINADGVVNAFDIDPFVQCVTHGGCQ